MTDFLESNYELPSSGNNYMKFKEGDNKFRILSKPIVGWLDWKDKSPRRFVFSAKPEKPIDPTKQIRHFWAMIVFDYYDNAVKILEITQSTIQLAIKNYSKDEEWGAPYNYDFKVIRKGKEKDTEYFISASPKKQASDEMKKAALDKPINLMALFDNTDPFTIVSIQTEIEINLPF